MVLVKRLNKLHHGDGATYFLGHKFCLKFSSKVPKKVCLQRCLQLLFMFDVFWFTIANKRNGIKTVKESLVFGFFFF